MRTNALPGPLLLLIACCLATACSVGTTTVLTPDGRKVVTRHNSEWDMWVSETEFDLQREVAGDRRISGYATWDALWEASKAHYREAYEPDEAERRIAYIETRRRELGLAP